MRRGVDMFLRNDKKMDAVTVIERMRTFVSSNKYMACRDKEKQIFCTPGSFKAEGRLQAWEEMQERLDLLQAMVEVDIAHSQTRDLISL